LPGEGRDTVPICVPLVRLVVTLIAAEDKPSDLILSALVRARFCETLSPKVQNGDSDLFLLGLMSQQMQFSSNDTHASSGPKSSSAIMYPASFKRTQAARYQVVGFDIFEDFNDRLIGGQ